MSEHSVAEAKNKLPDLINRALKGEDVVITRHGRPVVELRAIPEPIRPQSMGEGLDWLARRRIKPRRITEDVGTLVSRMRDEDSER